MEKIDQAVCGSYGYLSGTAAVCSRASVAVSWPKKGSILERDEKNIYFYVSFCGKWKYGVYFMAENKTDKYVERAKEILAWQREQSEREKRFDLNFEMREIAGFPESREANFSVGISLIHFHLCLRRGGSFSIRLCVICCLVISHKFAHSVSSCASSFFQVIMARPTRKTVKNPMNEVITREFTIHLHKRIKGMLVVFLYLF